ncbi:MAG TPA: YjbQ family protein [Ignavibacteria bacterium]|nr:YjbQ family protein [Ignavibacteria bacterium]
MWFQKELQLKPRPRGFHLITDEIILGINELKNFKVGLANLFIKHTSASLTINENASPDVRVDLESYFNKYVPENASFYEHTTEGPDDMPAHIKASLMGASLNIPIKDGRLNLGTWQGVYLCEHRNHGGSRKIVVTISGETYE